MKELKVGKLNVKILSGRKELGQIASRETGDAILKVLQEKGSANIIFASAPSQNEFLQDLACDERIDWSKINAFNMDEYVGIDPDHPSGFGNYLKRMIYNKVKPGKVYLFDTRAKDPSEECRRYADLLQKNLADIVFYGIGESCHLAFNDPPVADFNDKLWVKNVKLDPKSIQQQVNDKCFNSIEEVPTMAYTITIPVIMRAPMLFGMVPGKTKTDAIYHTLNDDISTACPSTILRTHSNAVLYIDEDSAAKLSV
jgi:glucosamine-6-phosphate deaminase